MARNPALDQARAELRKRVQDVNRKIARLERQGARVRGTEFDPRKQVDIGKIRTRDLVAYRRKLDAFQSRKTQFVGDTRGRPIPIQEWRNYTRAQSSANRKADALFDSLKDVFIPPTGMTIGQRDAAVRDSLFPGQANAAVNSPMMKFNRVPSQIASRKALIALTKQQQAKVKPTHLKEFVDRSRDELRKMLTKANIPGLQEKFDKLTDKQFHIVWAYSGVSTELGQDYETMMRQQRGDKRRPDDETLSKNYQNVNSILDWASKLKD